MNTSTHFKARFQAREGHARTRLWLAAALSVGALAGCQNMPAIGDPKVDSVTSAMNNASATPGQPGCKPLAGNSNTKNAVIGAAGGAVAGGIIGSQTTKTASVGARNGALLGAVGGALVGSQYNKMIGVSEQPDGSVKLDIPGSVMFRSGSAEISPQFGTTLDSVGKTVREYCGLTATVVGHTDNVGSADLNQRLSIERANSVVGYLRNQGVQPDRVRAEGRGMNEPIASNTSDAGRAQNRRVEVFVRQSAK